MAKKLAVLKLDSIEDARDRLECLQEEFAEASDASDEIKDRFATLSADDLGVDGVYMLALHYAGTQNSDAFGSWFVEADPVRMALIAVVHWLRWSQDEVATFLELSKARVSQYMNFENTVPKHRAREIRDLLRAAIQGWMAAKAFGKVLGTVSDRRLLAADHVLNACMEVLGDLTEYLGETVEDDAE